MIVRGVLLGLLICNLAKYDHGFLVVTDYVLASLFFADSLVRVCVRTNQRYKIRISRRA